MDHTTMSEELLPVVLRDWTADDIAALLLLVPGELITRNTL